MDAVTIPILRLTNGVGLPLPAYASAGAAGLDVVAAADVTLASGAREAVPTGFALAVPSGWEVQVRPRSGLALRHGLTCLNTPGTVDSDYRGEVKVILVNHGAETVRLRRGERIAQLVAARVVPVRLVEAEDLDATTRGSAGFGSTGS